MDPLPLDELKLTLTSVKDRQKFFASKELPSLYKAKAKGLLAHYYSLYSLEGFGDHVAIDDCDVAQFAEAIIGTDTPHPGVSPSVSPVDRPNRPAP